MWICLVKKTFCSTLQAKNGGKRVGIIGIGGLGQMGVRLAKAMGRFRWGSA